MEASATLSDNRAGTKLALTSARVRGVVAASHPTRVRPRGKAPQVEGTYGNTDHRSKDKRDEDAGACRGEAGGLSGHKVARQEPQEGEERHKGPHERGHLTSRATAADLQAHRHTTGARAETEPRPRPHGCDDETDQCDQSSGVGDHASPFGQCNIPVGVAYRPILQHQRGVMSNRNGGNETNQASTSPPTHASRRSRSIDSEDSDSAATPAHASTRSRP